MRFSRMRYFERIKQEVSSSPDVSANPHRFGGKEFRFGTAEIGHIHTGEDVEFRFRVQFAMRFSLTVSLRSTGGCRTQAGSRFKSGTKETSSMRCG
jgi:hypothetical protein